MGEANALARAILHAGAAKQVEDPLMILLIDPAAVVCHFVDNVAGFSAAGDANIAGNARFQVFQRIVDQVREDLLQRQPVADDRGKGSILIAALASSA